jgi:hypothetical protein
MWCLEFGQSRTRNFGHWSDNQCIATFFHHLKVKGKAIPLQAFTGLEGSRRLKLPGFKTIDTWRWQGCQPYAPAAFSPQNIPCTNFCWGLSRPQGHSAAGRIMSMKNSNDTIGNRSRNLPVCSSVPQPLRHRVPLHHLKTKRNLLYIRN